MLGWGPGAEFKQVGPSSLHRMIRILMVLYSADYDTPLGNDKKHRQRGGNSIHSERTTIGFDTFRFDVALLRCTLHDCS